MNEFCYHCILDKNLKRIPEGTPEDVAQEYRSRLYAVMESCRKDAMGNNADLMIKDLRHEFFREEEVDYTGIKRYFNDLVMELVPVMEEKLGQSQDPLKLAIQYAMAGNLIDFAALENVDESLLVEKIREAEEFSVDERNLAKLKKNCSEAQKLVYITDNCGEIVMDKILIGVLCRQYPNLDVTVIVRGRPTVNDATMEDALQIGLDRVCTVLPAGTDAGDEAIEDADLLILKGQANYEAHNGWGRNAYYILMCKCALFRARFQAEQFAGILTHEADLEPLN